MKRVLALLALSMFLVLGSTSAQAAKANKPARADRQAKKDHKGVVGTVVKVDGMNIVVKTRGKQGGEVTVITDASTKFTMGKKDGTIADVKEGENVVVSPATGTAQKVLIRPGKGGKAKGAKAANNA